MSSSSLSLAIVGATGLVGQELLKVLAEHRFPVGELLPVASAASVGQTVRFGGRDRTVIGLEAALAARPAIAIFSAGAGATGSSNCTRKLVALSTVRPRTAGGAESVV